MLLTVFVYDRKVILPTRAESEAYISLAAARSNASTSISHLLLEEAPRMLLVFNKLNVYVEI
jgi:hypothetical protein